MSVAPDWTSAGVILAAGLILGVLFVIFVSRRRNQARVEVDLKHKDLEARRDALLQQLQDPGLSADERTRLELETAGVLRQLDQSPTAVSVNRPVETPGLGMNPTIKGFLWGAGSIGALALLFYFVMQSATPRTEGGSVTGNLPSEVQVPVQPDPVVMQLEAAVQRDPNNLQLRNDLAQAYLERDNLMAVFEQTKYVLERSPNDGRALIFQGLVRMAMGEVDEATQMLRRATKADPKNMDGWVALAWVYAQSERMPEAEKVIAEAAKISPDDRQRLEQILVQMKQAAQQSQGAQPAQTGSLPEGHPPLDAQPAPAAATPAPVPATTSPGVRVTLTLDPAAQARSGVVFIIARAPTGGPPFAVKRIMATSFPITAEITAADSMSGQLDALPGQFRLEARLDTDGDAMTKPPTDPSGMLNDVAPGTAVTLVLK